MTTLIPGLTTIRPIVNPFRIAFTHNENNGRRVWRAVVRKLVAPIRLDEAGFGEFVDVRSNAERNDVCLQAVRTARACLPDPP